MAEDKTTFSEDKKEQISSLDVKAKAEELRGEVIENLEDASSKTTKTGRKSKEAKDAENQMVLIGGVETILTGFDAIISSKLPELKHEPEEIKTISTLSAPVLAKHFDLDAIEYKEEIKLLSYLFMCEMEKVKRLTARLKKEAKEKAEKQAKNQKDLEDASKRKKG